MKTKLMLGTLIALIATDSPISAMARSSWPISPTLETISSGCSCNPSNLLNQVKKQTITSSILSWCGQHWVLCTLGASAGMGGIYLAAIMLGYVRSPFSLSIFTPARINEPNQPQIVPQNQNLHNPVHVNLTWPKPGDPNAIHFYNNGQAYYSFSNTFESGSVDPKLPVNFSQTYLVKIAGKNWRSTEHWFQANKFSNPWQAYQNGMQNLRAGQLQGQHYQAPQGWHGVNGKKIQIMLQGLREKFSQNPALRRLLLSTGNAKIVEAAPHDKEWGAGADLTGKNYLGQMLMHVRNELNSGIICSLNLVDNAQDYNHGIWYQDDSPDINTLPANYPN